ncbi:MAG TPA: DUF1592 domain-containing protein [Polyangia bacterium]|nr:DUF1592 domain-containing protein [Polyangia bacterium]
MIPPFLVRRVCPASTALAACLALTVVACVGNPGGENGSGGSSGSGGGSGGSGGSGSGGSFVTLPTTFPAPQACNSNNPGPRLLRRLTATQVRTSIADLFQDNTAPVSEIFNDQAYYGFRVDSPTLVVKDLNADQLMTNAETVAAWAASGHMGQVGSCTTVDATCAKTLIQGFGKRAYRSPIPDNDARIARYTKIFMAESTFADAAAALISTMLQSPYFLYRFELGSGSGNPVALTPYEVATSLSYLLTGSTPDATLLGAADMVAANKMKLGDMIDQNAQRLLGDLSSPASQSGLMTFANGWLGLDRLYSNVKDDNVFKLTASLRDSMTAETRNLLVDTFKNDGSVADLLTADHSFLNADLAAHYGLSVPGIGSSFQKVTYTSSMPRDGGLLAHGSILTGWARADVSSPTQRGRLVRSHFLCEGIPPPPDNLDVTFKPAAKETTTRAHYEQHSKCGGACHPAMDPIGFAFEHYDAFGRHRDQENGYPIDATATIVRGAASDVEVKADGLSGDQGLATALAQNPGVNRCLVRYWSYYAYCVDSWSEDACTYNAIEKEAMGSDFALKNVLMGILHAPHFTTRGQ